jgi:hypothetical protein
LKILIASTALLAGAITTAPAMAQGGDDCASATAIAGQGTHNFDSSAATTGTQGQIECGGFSSDIWFTWTADATGLAVINTCTGATFDTKLAAFPGAGCPVDGTSLACNDDSCGLQSQIAFAVTNGGVYTIQVGSFGTGAGGLGSFDVSIAAIPPEDNCATPGTMAGQGIFTYDTTAATTGTEGQLETNCDFFAQTSIGFDVWYTWTPDATGLATLTTCGTAWDTKIAIWPGTGCPTDGTSIACNDDDCALQSTITANVVAGQQYTLQLGAYPLTGIHDIANLDISIASTGIGTNYCTSVPNSTGGASVIGATGSDSLGAANFTLGATNAPANQPAIFFFGNGALSAPFGNGTLCAGGTIKRGPVIVESGGTYSYSLDFGAYGPDLGAGGASTFFQCWYRDPAAGGAFFNTSDGLEVVFLP